MITKESIKGRFPVKELSDIADFLDSRRRPITASERIPGPYPYYGANGQQDSVADYIFDEPLILLAEDGGLFDQPDRGIAYAIEGKTWVNNHAHVLRPKDSVHLRYLVRVLENYDVKPWITGSTRDKLTKSGASKIQIPLPPLAEQKRIAAILDATDALRAKRREALAQLDALLQSTFLDLFGDPVTNPKGWEQLSFNNIGKFVSGATPSKSRDDFWDGIIPWVSPKDMKVAQIFDAQDHVSQSAFDETNLKLLKPGHLLIVVRGMILAHSFPVASNYVSIAINQDMKGILPSRAFELLFLKECVRHLKRKILAEVSTAGHGTRRFDAEAMRKISVPTPPLDLQRRFAAIVESVERQKARMRTHLAELDALFASLQSRAFNGEL